MKNKFAFTLAEVLITLVIIGVVAALTIPTVITKYQKTETVTKLKKAYSTLTQTTRRAVADYGNIENWEVGAAQNPDSVIVFFNTYMAPYLSLSSEAKKTGWDRNYFYLNGTQHVYGDDYARAYLADGSSLTMIIQFSEDAAKWIHIDIDINGDKKPNKLGKDIFDFLYFVRYPAAPDVHGTFQPSGVRDTRDVLLTASNELYCNKRQSGRKCSAVIMKDGWQIKNDYPW